MTLVEEVREKLKVFDYSGFTFDPIPHKYYVDGVELKSVTTFIGDFHEHFDAEAVAAKVAPKRNTTPEALIKEWKDINEYACSLGHNLHEYIEHYIDGNIIDTSHFDENMVRRVAKFETFYESRLRPKITPIAQEVRMFSKRMKLAGTFDFLVMIDNKVWILDWKSNRKLVRDETMDFKKYMFKPFDNLLDHNYNHYSIQTSVYRMMLKREANIDVEGTMIIYIPDEGNVEPIKTKDLRPLLNKYFGFIE
jgi:ATP-dependent exoDNAse (exonuclease V) beta subunit